MEQKPLLLDIKHGFNFRDLGSYETLDGRKIKKHKILRSANLAYLSERDVNYLDDYGLRYDVDFRSISEKEVEPDRILAIIFIIILIQFFQRMRLVVLRKIKRLDIRPTARLKMLVLRIC